MYFNSTTTEKNVVIISYELFLISLFLNSRKKELKKKNLKKFSIYKHILKKNLQTKGRRIEGFFFMENTIIMVIITSKIKETNIIN